MRRLIATAVAVALLTSGSASGQSLDDPGAPGAWPPADQRPAASQLADTFAALGRRFWTARNVYPCPPGQLEIRIADDLSGGRWWERGTTGRGQGCVVWLHAPLLARAEARPASDHAVELCRVIVHELGHTAGLPDGPGGVMNPAAEFREGTPWDCRVRVRQSRSRVPLRRLQRSDTLTQVADQRQ